MRTRHPFRISLLLVEKFFSVIGLKLIEVTVRAINKTVHLRFFQAKLTFLIKYNKQCKYYGSASFL